MLIVLVYGGVIALWLVLRIVLGVRDALRIEARMVAEDEMLEHVEARHAPIPTPDLDARRRDGIRRAQLHEAAVRRGKRRSR